MPYLGSKNAIAEWIVNQLPAGDCLADLFCGGCAVTHAAMLSGKWNEFIINDIDKRLPDLFTDAINGKYTIENHPEWISREEFESKKYDDAFIALVWSFGNNGLNYLYGRNSEPLKKAFHYAVFFNDYTLFDAMDVKFNRAPESLPLYGRYL